MNSLYKVHAYNFSENLTQNGFATQSSPYDPNDLRRGKPENAVNPPISNQYSLDQCSSTKLTGSGGTLKAWWIFTFSFGIAYITDITIYYREKCKYNYNL